MTTSTPTRRVATTALLIAGLLTLAGCGTPGAQDEPESPSTPEPTSTMEQEGTEESQSTTEDAAATYDADTVAALLPDLSPGGATYGEDPYLGDTLVPVNACYETVADEDDGDLLNGFYGEYYVDAVWFYLVVTDDAETAAGLARSGIDLLAGCAGTTPDTELIDSESIDSGTETVAGSDAGWAIYAVEGTSGTTNDATVIVGLANLVIAVTTGDPDPETAKENALAYAEDLVAAVSAG